MNVIKFRQDKVKRQKDEKARLKVAAGPDMGSVFVLFSAKTTLGRGEKCDVMISDLKASRHHATLSLGGYGWNIEDHGSANGLVHNGVIVRNARLRSGDIVSIGDTTFEFLSSEEGTQILAAPAANVERQLEGFQAQQQVQQRRINALTSFGLGKGIGNIALGADTGSSKKSPLLRAILIFVLLIGGALFFLDDSSKKQETSNDKQVLAKPDPVLRDLASFLPRNESIETLDSADSFFRSGFREFREKNYLRAKMQFETVLQIYPAHKLARIYLDNCDKAIEGDVKSHLDLGRKSLESGKLTASQGHFEYVMRLLHRQPTHPNYIEAKDNVEKIKTEKRGRS